MSRVSAGVNLDKSRRPRRCGGGALLVTRIHLPEAAAASFRLDGVERALARHGVPVRVLTTTTPGREGAPAPVPDDPEGVRVSRWPALRDASGYLRGYLPYMSYDLPVALRLGTASRPDIVLVEPPPTTGVVVRAVCALRRLPYVWYAPDVWSDATASTGASDIVVRVVRAIESWAVRGAVRVIAVNEGVAERARAMGARDVVIVPNGVDTSTFTPDGARPGSEERVAMGLTGPYFVYAGTASEWQGAGVFVQALEKVRRTHPTAQILYLGQGSDWERIGDLARRLPVGPDGLPGVVMHGLLPAQEAARWQRGAVASLVSIIPGQGYDFAYPTKVLAALGCGVPVVYAGTGPVVADVEREHLGWAASYDVDAVARAMVAALEAPDDPGRPARLSRWVLDNRSLKATGEAVARTLRAVLCP